MMGMRRGQWIKYSHVALILYPFLLANAAPQSIDDPAGPQAARIDSLWRLMLYLLSAIFAIVMIVLAVAVFRRDRASDEKRISRTVTASVIGTAVILFGLLVSSFLVGRAIYLTPDTTSLMTIEVNARQWWWDVRYHNSVPSQIVTTANEIHIPVGQPIAFRLSSMDVIHSFWVPNLHGKTDMIPGRTVETWLQADRPGIYPGSAPSSAATSTHTWRC